MNRHLFSAMIAAMLILCGVAGYYYITSQVQTLSLDSSFVIWIEDGRIYITSGNLLEPYFREPFETLMTIYVDFSYVTWSSHNENGIRCPVAQFVDYLISIKKPINEAIAIIHNHSTPQSFSPADLGFLDDIKARGFSGIFGIYYRFNQSVRYKTGE